MEKAFEILRAPLTAEEIEWKIIAAKGGQTVIAPYIDARAVMERFDRAFGPLGWRVSYRGVTFQVGGRQVTGFIARLEVRTAEGEWIAKEDGAELTDVEALKGGISSALKRAATAWGIGRELYTYPRIVIEGEHPFIPFKVLDRLKGLPAAVARGDRLPPVIRLTPEGEDVRRKAS